MQRNWFTKTRVLFLAALALLLVAETSWAQRSSRRASRRSSGWSYTPVSYSDYYYSPTWTQYTQQPGYQTPQTVTVTATYQYVTREVVQYTGGGRSYVTYQTVPVLVSYSTSAGQGEGQAPLQTAQLPISDPRRAFYPAPDQAAQAAIIDMRLPAGAEVFFDGQRTTQTGTLRQFVTPPLSSDRNLTYEVRARWIENGQVVDRARQLRVTPGGRVLVDFLSQETNTQRNNNID